MLKVVPKKIPSAILTATDGARVMEPMKLR